MHTSRKKKAVEKESLAPIWKLYLGKNAVCKRIFEFFFLNHAWQCLRATYGSELRHYFWQAQENIHDAEDQTHVIGPCKKLLVEPTFTFEMLL